MPLPRMKKSPTRRTLDRLEIEQFRASCEASGLGGPRWNAPAASLADSMEVVDPATADGSCLRGVLFALGLETCLAFAVYGVWQMTQVLR
jgi:hypothetical protein